MELKNIHQNLKTLFAILVLLAVFSIGFFLGNYNNNVTLKGDLTALNTQDDLLLTDSTLNRKCGNECQAEIKKCYTALPDKPTNNDYKKLYECLKVVRDKYAK